MPDSEAPSGHALPGDLSHIKRLLQMWSNEEQIPPGRLQQRLGVFVVAGMFDALRDEQGHHRLILKGGGAMELRFGSQSRESRDLDAVFRGNLADAHDLVRGALEHGWNGFTGQVSPPELIRVPGIRIQPLVRTRRRPTGQHRLGRYSTGGGNADPVASGSSVPLGSLPDRAEAPRLHRSA